MSAYVIFDVKIGSRTHYQDYMQQVKLIIEAAEGRYLVRGGPHKVYEGDREPKRLVLFDFRLWQPLKHSISVQRTLRSGRSVTNAVRCV